MKKNFKLEDLVALGVLGIAGLVGIGSYSIFQAKKRADIEASVSVGNEFGSVIDIKQDEGIRKYLEQCELTVVEFGPSSKKVPYSKLATKFKNVPFIRVDPVKSPITTRKYMASPGIHVYIKGKLVPDSHLLATIGNPANTGMGLEFYVSNYLKTRKADFDPVAFASYKQQKKVKSQNNF